MKVKLIFNNTPERHYSHKTFHKIVIKIYADLKNVQYDDAFNAIGFLKFLQLLPIKLWIKDFLFCLLI